jgi:hypothetical protein
MREQVRQHPNLTYQSVSRLAGSGYRSLFKDTDSDIAYCDVASKWIKCRENKRMFAAVGGRCLGSETSKKGRSTTSAITYLSVSRNG